MELPGDQDELIARVAAANPTPSWRSTRRRRSTMGWADACPRVLVTWFGGQEMANALADVLFGETEPGGRLPTTFPLRLEHNPSFGNFPGENGQVRYGEGVFVGYRWYEARGLPVRFPFGHGLSYTTFAIGAPRLSSTTFTAGGRHAHDRGRRDQHRRPSRRRSGAVLRRAAPPGRDPSGERAEGVRQGVARARRVHHRRARARRPGLLVLAARGRRTTTRPYGPPIPSAEPPPPPDPGWRVEPGHYDLHLGRSSAAAAPAATVEVA